MDLRRIRIRDADLSRAYMDSVLFDGAHLEGVLFHNAILRNASFRDAFLDSTQFQDLPFLQHPSWVNALCFSPDGRSVATGCHDGVVRVWFLQRCSCVMTFAENGHEGPVTSIIYDPKGKYLATGDDMGTVMLWNVTKGLRERVLDGHEVQCTSNFYFFFFASVAPNLPIYTLVSRSRAGVFS